VSQEKIQSPHLQIAIIDTNVVVAGLLTHNQASPVANILNGMLSNRFRFVVSEALMAEYLTVLLRPNLRKQHGLNLTEVETLLTDITHQAIVLTPFPASKAPDPGDQMLWDLLAARHDLCLVTGDKLLLEFSGMQTKILTPRAFVDFLNA
jgi:uncharacterized protein